MPITITKDRSIEDAPYVSCRKCKHETKHSVLASIDESGSDQTGNHSFDWNDAYQIVQCRGCDTVSFRKVHTNSEDYYHEYINGGPEFETFAAEHIEIYPDSHKRREPIDGYYLLDGNIQRIYLETLQALHSSQPVLCGVGIRAIIETVCKEKATTGKLNQRIDELAKIGVFTKDAADILHKLRIMGNEAAHEVRPHKNDKLNLALNIVDNLLMSVYILPIHAKENFD